MVPPRNTDTRLDGLEKVVGNLEKKTETLATMVNELKIQCLKMPWLKLLLMRCSSLSWDKFTQELLRRFGDAADRVAKIQPKITPTSNDSTAAILPSLPTVTTPLMSSSSCPPTTTLQELPAINTSTNHPDLDTTTYNSTPRPCPC